MADYIIGIDESTQSTKAFLYDQQGKIVAKSNRKHRQIINDQGWISHDLDEIYANLMSCVDEVVKVADVDATSIKAIGLTNQRETVAAWSRSSGKPLGLAVVWQDARSDALCQQLRMKHPGLDDLVREKSGIPLSPYFPAAKMAWLLTHNEQVKQAANQHDLCLGTIDSWLLFQLTHGRYFVTEPSNACRTELMDLQTLTWDPELLNLFGIPEDALPTIQPSDSDFGKTDFNGVLAQPVTIHGVLGDSEAALYGQGGTEVGALKATYGTGSSIMVNVGPELVRSTAGLVSSIGWQQGGNVAYVLEGNINYTGALITWLKDRLHLINDAGETEQLALAANSKDQTVIVPAFTGLGAPYWLNEARATVVNMSSTTGREEFVKASLEAISLQIQAVIESTVHDIDHISHDLFVDGGPTHNDFLMQCQSNFSNLRVAVPNNEDMSAFGAALMAGNAVGFYDSSQVSTYLDYRYYEPKLLPADRQQKLQNWNDAIQTVNYHAQNLSK